MKKFITFSLVILLTLAFSNGMALAKKKIKKKPRVDNSYYSYAVKFVCGTNPGEIFTYPNGDTGLVAGADRIVPGTYATAINVHNPNAYPVRVRAKVALTYPTNNGPVGPVSDFKKLYLPENAAAALDCGKVPESFFQRRFDSLYYKGFVVIQSKQRLDVNAVYTAGPVQNSVFCQDPYRYPEYMDYFCAKEATTTNLVKGGKGNGINSESVSIDVEQYVGRKIVRGKSAEVLED